MHPFWPGDYEMMEAAWRELARTGVRPDWMERGWNPLPDDRRGKEVRRVEHPGAGRLECGARARGLESCSALKQEPGNGLFTGGVKLRWRWRNWD